MADNKDSTKTSHLPNDIGFSTAAIHHGYNPVEHSGAISPPVFFTSTYAFESADKMGKAAALGGMLYAREYNPTTVLLEERLAKLEGGEAALAVATGMAAFGTLTLTLLSQGDEIIVHETLYVNTTAMTNEGLPRFGIKVIPVDLSNPDNLDKVITPKTRMIYFETPVNPHSRILDIAAISAKARAHNILVVVDSTFATPALQRPLEHGADIVLHSLTKYINGHGDVLGGALIGRKDIIFRLHDHGVRYLTGATISPYASAAILRGLKTLPMRMERHCASGLAVAHYLEKHPAVAWVSYPFLPSHPDHEIAKRQMSGGSGMLAVGLKSGYEGARRFIDKLRIFSRAVSLGDVESLIYHPASILEARRAVRPNAVAPAGIGADLLRMSIGLEDLSDLIGDIEQALAGS